MDNGECHKGEPKEGRGDVQKRKKASDSLSTENTRTKKSDRPRGCHCFFNCEGKHDIESRVFGEGILVDAVAICVVPQVGDGNFHDRDEELGLRVLDHDMSPRVNGGWASSHASRQLPEMKFWMVWQKIVVGLAYLDAQNSRMAVVPRWHCPSRRPLSHLALSSERTVPPLCW